jgi:hypothetical protein
MRDRPSPPASRLPVPPANAAQSEESLLSPQLKAAWRRSVTPQREDRARVWSELGKATRGGAVSSTVDRVERAMAVRALGGPVSQLPYALSAKWLLPSALLSGAFAVALLQRPAPPAAPQPRQASRQEAAPAPPRKVRAPSAPPSVAPATLQPAQPVARPQLASHRWRAKSAAPVSAGESPAAPPVPVPAEPIVPEPPRIDLAGDLKRLQRAAAALASNDPAGALRLLDRPDALHADSPLSKEKTALRIMAGCALAAPGARTERDAFLLAEQHSPLGERVRAACAGLR